MNAESVIRQVANEKLDISYALAAATEAIRDVQHNMTRPSVLYRPRICIDGNQWCALYGDNLQDGVAGFGDSVQAAMSDFDVQWSRTIEQCRRFAESSS